MQYRKAKIGNLLLRYMERIKIAVGQNRKIPASCTMSWELEHMHLREPKRTSIK